MQKKNIAIPALAAVLVLSMAAFAVAGPGPGPGRGCPGGCGGPGNGPRAAFSQLTPEKQAEARAVMDKYEPEFETIRNHIWAKRSVLQAMINGGQADEKAITKLITDISSLRNKMRDLRAARADELVQATGIAAFGVRPCPGFGQWGGPDDGPGQGNRMRGPGMDGLGMGRGIF